MTETILVAGTASHVGKSTIVTGLCRHLATRGVSVAPYKAKNMSSHSRQVLAPDGTKLEIATSQYVQARAATIPLTPDINPLLLKPRENGESQLIVQGEPMSETAAGIDGHWEQARAAAIESYDKLATKYECIIAEGAGAIAEINRYDRDLANLATARFADASIVLVGDIERGGVFASLYGSIELLPDDIRERVIGAIITKHHGDRSQLESGIEKLETRTGIPILGVLPYDDPGLPAEDSLSQSLSTGQRETQRETHSTGLLDVTSPAIERAEKLVADNVDLDKLGLTVLE